MSDETVRLALRSAARLVVVEAPAGCGKTYQGAEYAGEVAHAGGSGRPLILTHTHAACSVFAERTRGTHSRIEIRTIDSLISQIATAYHIGLGLPADTAAWARREKNGYQTLAQRVARLLKRCPSIAKAIVQRHPIVICDEHQDSSGDQHAVIMSLLENGALLRVFADPMQDIYKDKPLKGAFPRCDWYQPGNAAQMREQLDYPHRWNDACRELGQWALKARESLKTNGRIDLRSGRPDSVSIVVAENLAQANLEYRLSKDDRELIDAYERSQSSLLILTHYNPTAKSLRAFFNRRVPLWEGHSRPALDNMVETMNGAGDDRVALAKAVVAFMDEVGKGFSPSEFGNAFEQEVRDGCLKKRRGKPAKIQELAQCLVDEPDHRGIAKMLQRLLKFKSDHQGFSGVEVDSFKEFSEAIRIGDFDSPETGLAEITHQRTYSRPKPLPKAISTIHKAKGLECESVIVMPCDGKNFPDNQLARCLLYVAVSRAKRRLLLVVSRNNPSPLLVV